MKFSIANFIVLSFFFVAKAGETLPEGKVFRPVHFEIVWAAQTNDQPKALWIYKTVPQDFSDKAISNMMLLGSFTIHDKQKLSEEDRAIDKNGLAFANEDQGRYLGISPALGLITYQDQKANDMTKPVQGIPSDAKVKKLALKLLDKMGIPRSDFATKSAQSDDLVAFGEKRTRGYYDQKKKKYINEIDQRGIFFARKIDGVNFAGIGVAGGFHVTFASHERISQLDLVWRNLQPYKQYEVASPLQMVNWIKQGRAILPYPLANPALDPNEINKLIVKDFSPLYKGDLPEERQEFTIPFAQLNCIANLGDSNVNVQLYCPILSTNSPEP